MSVMDKRINNVLKAMRDAKDYDMKVIWNNKLTKGKIMPDISKFKSVSVSMDTHSKLLSLAQNRFEVPVSVQKVIEFLLEKEMKKKNGRSNGKARR